MRRAFQQATVILVGGVTLGLIANAVSPRRIPYIAPPKPAVAAKDIVTLEEARELWGTGAAFFLDARAPADFAAGHIANAFSLPAEAFEQHYDSVAPMLTPETPIVAYCDGVDCELSHHLADRLRQLGYKNVRVLVNGWTVWRGAGFPTQTGTAP
jgi:rhodanese-related sulfurtransferase